jgi:putative FmdB family regulatory protein
MRMPTYEFRCRMCGDTFTESRPMSQSSAPATCPAGHDDTVKLLGVAGVVRGGSGAPAASAPSSGGCCGGGCCG